MSWAHLIIDKAQNQCIEPMLVNIQYIRNLPYKYYTVLYWKRKPSTILALNNVKYAKLVSIHNVWCIVVNKM